MAMVVRSNIMAMNAQRQLGMNNNQVSKSLEKLSSGFRINRAGDDASGLAISEKMKAQIKGLEVASMNSQDGISLVQTAEGALTEVHDMLNRMVELAEKSANGTMEVGENGAAGTDRQALQDEMDELAKEIDRIASGTNFNNIKLLDGTLAGEGANNNNNNPNNPTGTGLTDINLGDANTKASFTMNIADTSLTDGQTITVGDKTFKLTGSLAPAAGDEIAVDIDGKTKEQALEALAKAITTAKPQVGGQSFTAAVKNGALVFTAENNGKLNVTEEELKTAVKVGGGNGGDGAGVEADATVENVGTNITGKVKDPAITFTQPESDAAKALLEALTNGNVGIKGTITADSTEGADTGDSLKFELTGTSAGDYTLEYGTSGTQTGDKGITGKQTVSIKKDGEIIATVDVNIEADTFGSTEINADNTFELKFTEKASGASAVMASGTPAADAPGVTTTATKGDSSNAGKLDVKFDLANLKDGDTLAIDGKTIKFVAKGSGTDGAAGAGEIVLKESMSADEFETALKAATGWKLDGNDTITGDHKISWDKDSNTLTITEDENNKGQLDEAGLKALATYTPAKTQGPGGEGTTVPEGKKAVYSLDVSNLKAGDKITIGDVELTAEAADGASAAATGTFKIGANTKETLENIAKAYADVSGDAGLKVSADGTKLEYTGQTAPKMVGTDGNEVTPNLVDAGGNNNNNGGGNQGGLTLQIGDTNDDFNKLNVSIGDMSMESLFGDYTPADDKNQVVLNTLEDGTTTIDITSQDKAGKAMDAIKYVINKVSSQRAKLGATQNRLEHTINNLDVAAENMSSANSRIRDTDMAKQMMDYTKMNVLTQAAQAMLAQANQQPQSILQLLQ